jgi:hypothetical protein
MADITGLHLGRPFKFIGKKLKSAVKGAAAGGALGFGVGGPAGVVPGAAAGATAGVAGAGDVVKELVGKGKTAISDTPADIIQKPIYSPEQQQAINLLLQLGSQNIQNPYSGFEPIAQNAYNDFFEDIVPGIKETFAGIGSSSSPALHSALSGAGATLAQRLAAMQSEYGMQNRGQGLQQLQLGLNPLTTNLYQPSQPGFGSRILDLLPSLVSAYSTLNQNQQTSNLIKQLQTSR